MALKLTTIPRLLLVSAAAAGVASGANLVANGTFEQDEVNASARIEPGKNPDGWEVGGEIKNAGGLVDASVVGEGSPFEGGSKKSLLLFDHNRADPRADLRQAFKPQTEAITVSFDLRVNDGIGHSDSGFFVAQVLGREAAQEKSVAALKFQCSGELKELSVQGNDGTLMPMLRAGVWYRFELRLPAVRGGGASFTVTVTEPGSTPTVHTIALAEKCREGYSIVHVSSGYGPDGVGDFNLDNVSVTVTQK